MTNVVDEIETQDGKVTMPKIIVIDDSRMIRRSAEKMLRSDFDVVLAEDGAAGIEAIQKDSKIQVAFTDLNMPGMSGYDVIVALRGSEDSRLKNIPIIVITSADEDAEEVKNKVLELGATDFITKPFNAADLKARAQAHAHYQQETQALQEQVSLDRITGLMNQDAFAEELGKNLSSAFRHQHDISVLKVSIDKIDDLLSRLSGAAVENIIKAVSKHLSKMLRQEDSLAHCGQGIFEISLPHSSSEGAVILSERIIQKIGSIKLLLKGEPLPLAASVGLCSVAINYRLSIERVIAALNKASITAKKSENKYHQIILQEEITPSENINVGEVIDGELSIDQILIDIKEGRGEKYNSKWDAIRNHLSPLLKFLGY